MASIDGELRLRYPLEVTPQRRVLASFVDAGGLPVRRLKHGTRTYSIRAQAFHVTAAEADSLWAFLETHADGAIAFTLTNPDDGLVYNCITDPAQPVGRRLVGPNMWEFDLALIGVQV